MSNEYSITVPDDHHTAVMAALRKHITVSAALEFYSNHAPNPKYWSWQDIALMDGMAVFNTLQELGTLGADGTPEVDLSAEEYAELQAIYTAEIARLQAQEAAE